MFRIGLGQDSHAFDQDTDKALVLGGVVIENTGGLSGDSDADVILHSICNALSSAVGGDSLGTWADELCLKRGTKDSRVYVKRIMEKVMELGFRVENVAISVEVKKPRISLELVQTMKKTIASLLNIQPNQVGITFTSGEGLTSFGRGEGIQALSVVLMGTHDESHR
ncbi:2-C-methyl-D-erythritol 2,4-cyclodiphosphate synthase [Candidatus Gottesmanbacteria bacterium RIFCSPLOWO2_01_FULL_49_10]|uniref:2-C-methyl-D-erythritol 2,4-cyclodiphosphate synthase n=1 Tax=Candidatus Gottesmanbacteria bacterium RIFCSPLOWO2_01_FULL_49_10 TaxID=1798396 RepID=A0A1F6B1K5_9BACT|nr:MAG: 2-C-methyl-D-erythritol 2,4-cyclodiphosphate synthase [Microgenomates group bacterium GW2011_GWA2_47_8]OGG30798.1 MAG: 2-C-methyl-D-erythritol 2,4-cyclodiphosphate synthase [Candidatus Gottesmanbacteria bacterium RIFCSPLOWO2_01_FULL_49_10]